MDLSRYQELMREIDGQQREELAEGVTKKELSFREGRGKEGRATIYFKDNEPLMVDWYEWDLDRDWFLERLCEELGCRIELIGTEGGNGHYLASIQVQS